MQYSLALKYNNSSYKCNIGLLRILTQDLSCIQSNEFFGLAAFLQRFFPFELYDPTMHDRCLESAQMFFHHMQTRNSFLARSV